MPKARFKDGCIVTRVVPSGKWKFLASARLLVSWMFSRNCTSSANVAEDRLNASFGLKPDLRIRTNICANKRVLTPDTCLSRRPLEQRPKMIGGDAIDRIGTATVGGAPEKQFAPAVAVGIDRVDQFHARGDV